jgi:hypothetical protein
LALRIFHHRTLKIEPRPPEGPRLLFATLPIGINQLPYSAARWQQGLQISFAIIFVKIDNKLATTEAEGKNKHNFRIHFMISIYIV